MPDEPGGESIGGVHITITGDFSQLEADFQAAVADARSNGASVAQAISQAFDTLATHGEFASYQIKQVGQSMRDLSPAAAAASASVASLNTELDATGQNVAMAGENFDKLATKSGQSFRSMVSDVRFWARSIFILMAPEMLYRIIESVVKFYEASMDAARKSATEWRDFNLALKITDDELEVANAKLENTLAKLQGEPQNRLKLALLEAAEAADKLAKATDEDFKAIDKHLEESTPNIFTRLALGISSLGDLRETLKDIDASIAPPMAKIQLAIAAAKQEYIRLNEAAREWEKFGQVPPQLQEIHAVSALIQHLTEQYQRMGEEKKKAELRAAIGATEDLNAAGERAVRGWDAFYRRLDQEAAETTKILLELQKAQQGVADEKTREQGVMDKAWDKYVEGGQKAVAKTTEITVLLRDRLSPAMYQLVNDKMNMAKALSTLGISRESSEGLQKFADSLAIVGRSGTAADKALLESPAVFKKIAEAATEAGNTEQQMLGKMYLGIPEMFRSIEGSIAGNLVHWKSWGDTIKRIFQEIAQKGLQDVLGGILKGPEQALQQSIGGMLKGLVPAAGGAVSAAGPAALGTASASAAIPVAALGTAAAAAAAMLGAMAAAQAPGAISTITSGIGLITGIPGLAEGTDWVPHEGLYHLHAGEAVVPRSENVSNRYSTANYEHNASVGTHFDFRGSSFTGVTQDLVSNVMDKAVKMSRRSGAKW